MIAQLFIVGALIAPSATPEATRAAPGLEIEPVPAVVNPVLPAGATTALTVRSSSGGRAHVEILDEDQQLVSTLIAGRPIVADRPLIVRWNASGTDAPVQARVRLVAADGTVRSATAPIAMDRTAPTVRLRLGNGTTRGPVDLRLQSDDPEPARSASLVIEHQTGVEVAAVPIDPPTGTGWERRRWNGRVDGTRLMPGQYRLRVRVVDAAGNAGVSPARRLRVQRVASNRVLFSVPDAGRLVALTFDDCPDARSWQRLLDGLARVGAKGTFFCNGTNVAAHPELARRTVAEGHSIGAHTWDHPIMTRLDAGAQRRQIDRDTRVWRRVADAEPLPYYRAPYGIHDATSRQVAGALGYAYTVMWDVDPVDWRNPPAATLVERVVSGSRPGSIVVMHTTPVTADALPRMVRGLRARGLEPASLDQMLGVIPPPSRG